MTSLVDEIEKLTPPSPASSKKTLNDTKQQLEMLEEAERALKSIGVSLEPKFEIPIDARITPANIRK